MQRKNLDLDFSVFAEQSWGKSVDVFKNLHEIKNLNVFKNVNMFKNVHNHMFKNVHICLRIYPCI